ncbi:MAG: hypothetical protein COA78_29325 [Blastopirellula sp.]|nr:MAG: hypothetical protein COA78_29325 [Blastopirellula sp.]
MNAKRFSSFLDKYREDSPQDLDKSQAIPEPPEPDSEIAQDVASSQPVQPPESVSGSMINADSSNALDGDSEVLQTIMAVEPLEFASIHEKFKHDCMNARLRGETITDIARTMNRDRSTIARWLGQVAGEFKSVLEASNTISLLASEIFRINKLEETIQQELESGTISPNQKRELILANLKCVRERMNIYRQGGLIQSNDRLYVTVDSARPQVHTDDSEVAITSEQKDQKRAELVGDLLNLLGNAKAM